jgi:hypothetical protein
MTISLTPIQEHLLRFRYLDNSLHFLSEVCTQSKSDMASSIFFKYVTIDLVSFLDHYDSFIGLTTGNQRTLVLAMSTFLDEIFKNKQEIRDVRNKWTAHLLKGGEFQKELSKTSKSYSLQDLIIMINGMNLFVSGLHMIFPEDEAYVIDNFTKDAEELMEDSSICNETIGIIINDKIVRVNAKFLINNLPFQFEKKIFDVKSDT